MPEAEIAYAGKAFLCRAMARLVEEEGLSLDVCSAGEIAVARVAGFPAQRLVLHGNVKTAEDLKAALAQGVGRIVIDSAEEITAAGGFDPDAAPLDPSSALIRSDRSPAGFGSPSVGAAAPAQHHTRLAQQAVGPSVRAAGLGHQFADAGSCDVAVSQTRGYDLPFRTGDLPAFRQWAHSLFHGVFSPVSHPHGPITTATTLPGPGTEMS